MRLIEIAMSAQFILWVLLIQFLVFHKSSARRRDMLMIWERYLSLSRPQNNFFFLDTQLSHNILILSIYPLHLAELTVSLRFFARFFFIWWWSVFVFHINFQLYVLPMCFSSLIIASVVHQLYKQPTKFLNFHFFSSLDSSICALFFRKLTFPYPKKTSKKMSSRQTWKF